MSEATYTKVGPFTDASPPGIDHNFLNALETFCAAGWFDSAIVTNGSGVLTLLGLILNGTLQFQNPSTQTLANGNTITNSGVWTKVTTGGNATGIIMPAGSVTGQCVLLYNASSAGSVTFAASGSNVRGGSNVAIGTGRVLIMIWDGASWGVSANP